MLQNKYTSWYYSIIAKRQAEPAFGYTEKHHIVPTSLGGANSKTNLVRLTAREHFVCHKLLAKMTVGADRSKMVKAVWILKHTRRSHLPMNSRSFALLREEYARAAHATSLGMKASEETKAKMSASHSGKPKSEEHRQNIKIARSLRGPLTTDAHRNLSKAKAGPNNPNYGKRGPETSMFGKSHTDESRKSISQAFAGTKWWNNGILCKRSRECPDLGWRLGRLSSHSDASRTTSQRPL
jgi:hypothetical protein